MLADTTISWQEGHSYEILLCALHCMAQGEGKGGDGEERCEGQRHRLAGFEAASRRMFAAAFGGATGAAAPLPQREQVDYGDL